MSGATPKGPASATPRAIVRRKARFSLIWLLPIIAGAIGAYLAFKTISERGPEVTITFNSADGLTAGQTQVRHKNVNLGTVNTINLSKDMGHVIVRVRMTGEAVPYLTDHARFWVVRPRLSASNVSGLETLISGGYIEMDPGVTKGTSKVDFAGLETPPGVRSDEPGTTFVLHTARIGSLGSGSPVFYRDIVVGEVLGYQLPEGNGAITVRVFVRAPYDKWVRTATRFWNASGVRVELGGSGLHVELESIQAVLSGGVAFGTPDEGRETASAKPDTDFPLFTSEDAAQEASFKQRIAAVLYFKSSTAGLSVGSAVQLYGNAIGNVTSVQLELNPMDGTARVRVGIEIQPERLTSLGEGGKPIDPQSAAQRLVDNGMRAELITTSYVTGAQAVSLEFSKDPPPAHVSKEGDALVLPTQDGTFGGITTALANVANKLDSLPLTSIGNNANGVLAALRTVLGGPESKRAIDALTSTLVDVQALVKRTDSGISPLLRRLPEITNDLQQTLARTNHLVGSADTGYGANSQFSRDLERLMSQMNDAVRSVRLLADFLDRHPEALVRGRANTGAER